MSITTERAPTLPTDAPTLEVSTMTTPHTAASASVTLIEPMAGFDGETAFHLTPIDESGMLVSLRSASDPTLRFILSPARVFFGDYAESLAPVVQAPVAEALGTTVETADIQMYVLLTVGESLVDTTANLRAPLVIDHETGKAVQVVVDDDTIPIDAPLPHE